MLQKQTRLNQITVLAAIIRNAVYASPKLQEDMIRDAIDKCAELQAGLMTDLDNARTHK